MMMSPAAVRRSTWHVMSADEGSISLLDESLRTNGGVGGEDDNNNPAASTSFSSIPCTPRRNSTNTSTSKQNSLHSFHVRFPSSISKLEHTRDISRLSEKDLAEILAVWGDEEEEHNRKLKLKHDLNRVAEGEYEPPDEDLNSSFCTLGLLDKVGYRGQQKLQNREEAWDAVLWGQYHQLKKQEEEEERRLRKSMMMLKSSSSSNSKLETYHDLDDTNDNDDDHSAEKVVEIDYDELAKVYQEVGNTRSVQRQAQEEARRLERELQRAKLDPSVRKLLDQAELSRSNH